MTRFLNEMQGKPYKKHCFPATGHLPRFCLASWASPRKKKNPKKKVLGCCDICVIMLLIYVNMLLFNDMLWLSVEF